jgi:hypothetical protein
MGRSIFIVLLILVVLVSINPQAQAKISATWETIRPAVVESMDNLYAAVRNFVAGNGSEHQIHENPATPGVDFDVIITMKSGLPL